MIPKLAHFFQNEAERFGVRAAFLYGSFARGFPRHDSDLDVAIVFDDDCDEDIIYRRLVDISLLLSERSGRDVNVITIYWDFRKPLLYYNAIVLGIPGVHDKYRLSEILETRSSVSNGRFRNLWSGMAV